MILFFAIIFSVLTNESLSANKTHDEWFIMKYDFVPLDFHTFHPLRFLCHAFCSADLVLNDYGGYHCLHRPSISIQNGAQGAWLAFNARQFKTVAW